MESDDIISADAIIRGLKTRSLGRRVEYLQRVASTNDIAQELAEAGEPEGALVIADEQAAGRGRLGRAWIAPPHSSLLMSLVLRPRIPPPQMARVTMAVALGVCDGILGHLKLDARVKWPNDIVLRGRKCGGILAEGQLAGDRVEYVVVGLGLNVNFAAAEVDGIPGTATTIQDTLGIPTPRASLARAILAGIETYYFRLQAGEILTDEFAARLTTLGEQVSAQTPSGRETGVAERVDDDGALWLRQANHSSVRLIAGDVTLAPS